VPDSSPTQCKIRLWLWSLWHKFLTYNLSTVVCIVIPLYMKLSTILGTQLQRGSLTKVAPSVHKLDGDFRPPWVYACMRLISFAVIPGTLFYNLTLLIESWMIALVVGIYSVFFYDFGGGEHVFSPARRWATRGFNVFFRLSPAEERLLYQERQTSEVNQPKSTDWRLRAKAHRIRGVRFSYLCLFSNRINCFAAGNAQWVFTGRLFETPLYLLPEPLFSRW
jgi:hypothetical protein